MYIEGNLQPNPVENRRLSCRTVRRRRRHSMIPVVCSRLRKLLSLPGDLRFLAGEARPIVDTARHCPSVRINRNSRYSACVLQVQEDDDARRRSMMALATNCAIPQSPSTRGGLIDNNAGLSTKWTKGVHTLARRAGGRMPCCYRTLHLHRSPMNSAPNTTSTNNSFDPTTITRPDSALLRYYVAVSILTVVGFPFVFLPLFFKYHTLKYRFDDSGVSMSWGILFRREIHLTYRRIQDIHLTRNLIQRWMGLATVGIQTASGSAGPEMSIEGVLEAEQLRDYLYAEMRGAKGEVDSDLAAKGDAPNVQATEDEALSLLREIRDALRQLAERQTEA